MPTWIAPDAVSISGADEKAGWHNGYLVLSRLALDCWTTIRFELTEREIVLHHRSRDIRVRLRGDSVAAMTNFGADLTFFPALT